MMSCCLIVLGVSISISQALYAHATSIVHLLLSANLGYTNGIIIIIIIIICLAYGTSGHLTPMRSHTRSPAAAWDPDLTT